RTASSFLGQASDRVADRPGDQEEHRRRTGDDHDEQEILEATLEQGPEPEPAPQEEVETPDDRLDAVDALEVVGLPEPARKRVPRARERPGQRTPDRRRDEERNSPRAVHKDRLGEVDRGAV